MAIKTYPKGSMEMLAPNFRACEFDCTCPHCKATLVDEKLPPILQQIRDYFGKRVWIVGPYRCPEHNAEVANAAKGSLHTKGMAADIAVEDIAPAEVAKFAESIGVLGIGLYDTDSDGHFVHIDTRDYKSFWFGHAQEKRTTFGGFLPYTREQFVVDVQTVCGSTVDGISDLEALSKTVTIGAKFNNRHGCIKPVQRRLAALGYEEVGEADGEAGPKFAAALAHFQQDHCCTPTGIAEAWGKTWQTLLAKE